MSTGKQASKGPPIMGDLRPAALRDPNSASRAAEDWRATNLCSPCAISQMLPSCPSSATSSDLTEIDVPPQRRGPARCAAGHVAERREERLARAVGAMTVIPIHSEAGGCSY